MIRQVNVSCPPSPRLNIREGGYDRRLISKQHFIHHLSRYHFDDDIIVPRNQPRSEGPLYGLGHQRQPSPRATLAEVTFSLFLSKIQPTVYIRIANSSRGARQLGWESCLTSAGRVTVASRTTFLHINALACLTRTTLGVASAT